MNIPTMSSRMPEQVLSTGTVVKSGAPADKTFVKLLVGIGDRLGLFDELTIHGAATAPELAFRTGLNEGYVSEWLEAMVNAGRIENDPRTRRFEINSGSAVRITAEA